MIIGLFFGTILGIYMPLHYFIFVKPNEDDLFF